MRTCCLFGARKMNDQAWSYLTASKHQEYNNTRRNTRRRRVGRSVWNIIKKMFPFQNLQVRGSFCSISISAQRLGIFVIRSSKQSREKLEKLKERSTLRFVQRYQSSTYQTLLFNQKQTKKRSKRRLLKTLRTVFKLANENIKDSRCFDIIVFRRPQRYFSVALKVILSLFDRYKIFTND